MALFSCALLELPSTCQVLIFLSPILLFREKSEFPNDSSLLQDLRQLIKPDYSRITIKLCKLSSYIEWDIPCIARVMVRITLSGGVSNMSQRAGWNNY